MNEASTRHDGTAAGVEWLVDASGCRPELLRSVDRMSAVFDRIVADLDLPPIGPPAWHVFPVHAGLTGVLLLGESHPTCHTFPETGFAALNLYCCRVRAPWDWEQHLAAMLGAERVVVRLLSRGGSG
jgi:S-adenosylmethionine decarboxylase